MKTVLLSDERHKQLKIFSAKTGQEIQDVVDKAVKKYLTDNSNRS